MNLEQAQRSYFQRYLDPASRLGEILFGLIMVLTVTLTAGLTADSGRAGVRHLLVAAVSCNLAWGFIDAVMYVMDCMTERSARARLFRKVQTAVDRADALEVIRRQVEPHLQYLDRETHREAVYAAILEEASDVKPVMTTRITREDVHGAIACFWLVVLSCLPAAVPFLVFSSPPRALRVSNVLLIAMLFLVGQKWADYINASRLTTGLALVAIGLCLVGVAVLLGG
jgi:hypothetical protein